MEIIKADSLESALRMLAEGMRPAAGCTNILVDYRKKGDPKFHYADISALPQLQGICQRDGKTEIGAMTTFAEIEDAFKGSVGFEALVGAASQMGGPQVRNRATIGGNIADASPACDAGPVLLAMNASVKAVSVHGQRSIPVSDFFLGVRKTALAPDELLEKVTIPETPTHTAWRKVSLRMASAISVLSMAACRFSDGRLFWAAGAVAPRPVRLQNCEKCIEKGDLSAQRLKEALHADICPIDDIRADADYRRSVAENLLIDLLQKEFGYEIG